MQPSKRSEVEKQEFMYVFIIQNTFDWVTDDRAEIQNFRNCRNPSWDGFTTISWGM